jgi:hypothetical protein
MKVEFKSNFTASPGKLRPFPFKRKEWPNDNNKQKMKIENPNGGVNFSETLRVIEGGEHPELFLQWLQDFRSRIWENTNLTAPMKKDILLQLVDGEAATLINRTIQQCEKGIFQKQPIALKNRNLTNVTLLPAYKAGPFHDDVITECIHTLMLEVFGNDIS